MRILLPVFVCWFALCSLKVHGNDAVSLIVVTGIAGTEEYEAVFPAWSEQWLEVGERAGATVHEVGLKVVDGKVFRDQLRALLEEETQDVAGELWLVFHGHGTFDGENAKFNLVGPDVSATELAEWLKDCQRPLAVVCGFSASSPFINALSGPNRVILSATKSGYEVNYSRFGGKVADAIGGLDADLDKDGQVSLLEAFLSGARETEEFYQIEGRLASEHALIDDTGDRRGTGSDWFRGVRVVKEAKDKTKPDGRRAHQFHLLRSEFEQQLTPELREKRDQLEIQVLELRDRKSAFADEDVYYQQLEELLVKLSDVYATAESGFQ